MYMNMRDFPTPHLTTYKSKGTALLWLFFISVTVASSIMNITHMCWKVSHVHIHSYPFLLQAVPLLL
jgi:hypothetical protein